MTKNQKNSTELIIVGSGKSDNLCMLSVLHIPLLSPVCYGLFNKNLDLRIGSAGLLGPSLTFPERQDLHLLRGPQDQGHGRGRVQVLHPSIDSKIQTPKI